MAPFLSWLYNQAQKVYDWFSAAYWTFRDRLSNFWKYLQGIGQQALESAKSWTYQQIQSVYNTISGWIYSARQTLNTYIDQVRQWAYSIIVSVRDWLIAQYNTIAGWLNARIDQVRQSVDTVYHYIRERIQAVINDVSRFITDKINAIPTLIPNLSNILNWLSPQKISEIETTLNSYKKALTTFISDPIEYLIDLIFPYFVSVLCYALAYAMGTTKYQLPPIPIWSKTPINSPYNTPQTPYPESDKLVNPLDKMYVSGYRFGISHYGTDFGLSYRQPVYACHSGKVIYAGWDNTGYGYMVVLSSAIWWTLYAHLDAITVRVGDTVAQRQTIGLGNSTGNSTGNHLHLEIKYRGQYVNPLNVLPL